MGCPYATVTGNAVYHNEAYEHGGGISLHDSEGATLTSNEVYSNVASSGGGVQVSSSNNIVLFDNHVYDNEATDNWCGGIRVGESHTATLTSNHVYSNTASSSGGGICVYVSFDAALTGNHVYSNTAGTEGGGLYLSASTRATLMGNHVYSNTSGSFGGGIHLAGSFTSTLTGNEIYNNTSDAGGGIYALFSSDSTLTGNEVYSNTADSGGGIYLSSGSNITLTTNQVYSNTASMFGGGALVHGVTSTMILGNEVYSNTANAGGGIRLSSNDATLRDNHVHGNAAHTSGGIDISEGDRATLSDNDVHHNTADFAAGIYLAHSPTATLYANEVYSNTTNGSGGGVTLGTSPGTTLASNRIHHNTAVEGGGVYLSANSDTTIKGNWVYSNTTIDYSGAGFYIRDSVGVELVNNMVTENQVIGGGHAPGIFCGRADVRLLHNTLARNTGGDGSGIFVGGWEGVYSSVTLTNTILVSHTVGISVAAGSTAMFNATLWGNDEDWEGDGTIVTGTLDVWGDPGFVAPDKGDYHIGSNSVALDVGVEAGVSDDIDGDSRPNSTAPELGADEVLCYVQLGGTYYPTVQAAVDASVSASDVVQVAGTCRGVEKKGSVSQVVYITKTLTIRGGYSLDFSAWVPEAYPTLLDAQAGGPVIRIRGQPLAYITTTLEGLRLTNGSSSNGGGIEGQYAHAIISDCHVYNSVGKGAGGGFYCSSCAGSVLSGNLIYSNTAESGTAAGGGVFFDQSDNIQMTGNQVYDNLAIGSSFALGGGVYIRDGDKAIMVNNVIARNHITGSSALGSGLCFWASSGTPILRAMHTTLAENYGGGGQGIYVANSATVVMTNTILISHTVGIQTASGASAGLNATLWGNDTDWSGDNIVAGTYNWWGDPLFVDPEGRNYHLGAGSVALDRGHATGVSADLDGDPRTFGLAPDLGADEGLPKLTLAKGGLGWVNEGQVYTYTLSVTNSGAYTATNVVLTDAVPSGADFSWASDGGLGASGVVTWPTFTVLPGGDLVTRTFAVKTGWALTNSDYLVTADGIPSTAGAVFTTPLNLRPVAEAGDHQVVHSGVVTLDGSSSYDPEGDEPLDYSWLQQMGPVAVTLNNANTAVATFAAPTVVGLYRFRLFITDTRGARDSDWVNITISNDPPVADAGAPQVASPGATVTLDGSGSSDPDGDGLTYSWAQSGGLSVTLSSSAAASPTFVAPASTGVLTFALTVTDTFGLVDTDLTTVAVEQQRIYLPLVIRNYP
jgi:uncharacterized repeat protein (TIGR01451 family)